MARHGVCRVRHDRRTRYRRLSTVKFFGAVHAIKLRSIRMVNRNGVNRNHSACDPWGNKKYRPRHSRDCALYGRGLSFGWSRSDCLQHRGTIACTWFDHDGCVHWISRCRWRDRHHDPLRSRAWRVLKRSGAWYSSHCRCGSQNRPARQAGTCFDDRNLY